MNFCSHCGETVTLLIPAGDNRPRHVCQACGAIHYQNPKIVTGCIPVRDDRVLLCKRAIEPRYGLWTLPAGFMENGESSQQGAAREAAEEANARLRVTQLYTTFNLPHINQVYLFFLSDLLDEDFSAGDESLEVALFEEADIPWDELAFPVVTETLRLFFADRRQGEFRHRVGDICFDKNRRGHYSSSLLNED
ncbi:MAG: NUDIX hydrolase [Chromatiales bacterium]|jgi:ADP-ribose pyrophosphatase YjhB (NUDIX family)